MTNSAGPSGGGTAHRQGYTIIPFDGNVITANGPGAAYSFGFKLAEILAGADTAAKVKESMCF